MRFTHETRGSQQTGHPSEQRALVLLVHDLIGVQLQREGGIAGRQCSQDGGIALLNETGRKVNFRQNQNQQTRCLTSSHPHLSQGHGGEQHLVVVATLDVPDGPSSLGQVAQHGAEKLLPHRHLQGHHRLQDLTSCQPQGLHVVEGYFDSHMYSTGRKVLEHAHFSSFY